MSRITPSTIGDTPFERLLGHNPDVADHWARLEKALLEAPGLSAELKEQVRRTLAFENECEYCMAKGRPASPNHQRESNAVGFAQIAGRDHRSITEAQIEVLREDFNDTEISLLVALISFHTASQMFGSIMDLQPESS